MPKLNLFSSATISKVFSHWSTGSRKGRTGQLSQTLDPAITQSVLMNTYSAANHDIHTLGARNGNTIVFCLLHFVFSFHFFPFHLNGRKFCADDTMNGEKRKSLVARRGARKYAPKTKRRRRRHKISLLRRKRHSAKRHRTFHTEMMRSNSCPSERMRRVSVYLLVLSRRLSLSRSEQYRHIYGEELSIPNITQDAIMFGYYKHI